MPKARRLTLACAQPADRDFKPPPARAPPSQERMVIPQALPFAFGVVAPKALNREQWLTHIAVLLRPWCSVMGSKSR
jgi:hypothetical protein